jgi:hypothetical protein
MRTGRPEVNDINAKIRMQRWYGLEEGLIRALLIAVIGWLAHLAFSVWMGSLKAQPEATNLFTMGVTILAALLIFVPFWNTHRREMCHLKETKKRLEVIVSTPADNKTPTPE